MLSSAKISSHFLVALISQNRVLLLDPSCAQVVYALSRIPTQPLAGYEVLSPPYTMSSIGPSEEPSNLSPGSPCEPPSVDPPMTRLLPIAGPYDEPRGGSTSLIGSSSSTSSTIDDGDDGPS